MAMRPCGRRATAHGCSPPSSQNGSRQRAVLVGVAVRPAVHGDAEDVAGRIEAAAAEHPSQLVADAALDRLERRLQQLGPPGRRAAPVPTARACTPPWSCAAPPARPASSSGRSSPRLTGKSRLVDACHIPGDEMLLTLSFSKRGPLPDEDVGVDQRHLLGVAQRGELRRRAAPGRCTESRGASRRARRPRRVTLWMRVAAQVLHRRRRGPAAGSPSWATCSTVLLRRMRTGEAGSSSLA